LMASMIAFVAGTVLVVLEGCQGSRPTGGSEPRLTVGPDSLIGLPTFATTRPHAT